MVGAHRDGKHCVPSDGWTPMPKRLFVGADRQARSGSVWLESGFRDSTVEWTFDAWLAHETAVGLPTLACQGLPLGGLEGQLTTSRGTCVGCLRADA